MRRGIRVFRPEMTNVWELIAAMYFAMQQEGEIAPEVEMFEGRPWVARVTWASRRSDPGEAAGPPRSGRPDAPGPEAARRPRRPDQDEDA
jgi:hypothetical protein